MSLTDYKIKQSDIALKGVVAAPDALSGTAAENKAIFDRLIREAVMVYYNDLVDALVENGAEAILRRGDDSVLYLRVNSDKMLEISTDGEVYEVAGAGHELLDRNGEEMPRRLKLMFTNAEMEDSEEKTVITVTPDWSEVQNKPFEDTDFLPVIDKDNAAFVLLEGEEWRKLPLSELPRSPRYTYVKLTADKWVEGDGGVFEQTVTFDEKPGNGVVISLIPETDVIKKLQGDGVRILRIDCDGGTNVYNFIARAEGAAPSFDFTTKIKITGVRL